MSLEEEIKRFFKEAKNPVLFAGAGLSARAGLPVWGGYLTMLAEAIRSDDELTCKQILESVKAGDYTLAASYYFMSKKVREGDKFDLLAKPFESYDVTKIQCIAGLPFEAYVTTNFDRALLTLYSKATDDAPLNFDLGDPALAAAPFREKFFISRIHGRVESPQTMMLSAEHYKELRRDTAYNAFLRNIASFKNLLFIGFSFLDPAIREVLEMVQEQIGPLAKGRHTALLPENVSDDFIQRLEKLNIRRVTYSSKDNHVELWNAICGAARSLKGNPAAPIVEPAAEPLSVAHRYIAACYARSRVGVGVNALRDSVIEGVICHNLDAAGGVGITSSEIEAAVARDLVISAKDAAQIVGDSLSRLKRDGLCRLEKGRYILSGDIQKGSLQDAIRVLAGGVVDRYIVREQGRDSDAIRNVLCAFFNEIVVKRGWDLGAAFAAHRVPEPLEIERMFWASAKSLSEPVVEKLIYSTKSLLSSPTAAEAALLEAVGRAGFALELTLQSPRDVLFHSATLPQYVYLDANVLLPVLAPGHIYEPIYRDSIQRLIQAGAQAGMEVEVLVYDGFLNEIVSHRRIAKQLADDAGDKLEQELEQQIRLAGSANLNVFLSSYINTRGNNKGLTFAQYLAKHAPYETEEQLAKWILKYQVRPVTIKVEEGEIPLLNRIRHHLNVVFADELSSGKRKDILIEHDSHQILGLLRAQTERRKVVFATADRHLRDGLTNSTFASVAKLMMSHVALAQLIELLIGPSPNDNVRQALGRMLWTTRISSDFEVARNYFINLALSKFDEAMAMNMGDVVEKTAGDAADAARRQGISLVDAIDSRGAVKVFDQFEEGFFAGMREAIERRERQFGKGQ